ncbi:type II toxin-antitoxin system RelE/ParE family toxin [Rhodovastum sp. RN2-1]|uniref:Type II toxin-antitoxin system RelE/ParE family toxin n=2 Tax=Limobrevibacterium gyesilva TaxID=2991712 RepID=A0AA41YN55_9PROT|nr:type II toxin-antitoxin system RelE/ParE family toxin [Limobrevibacterium gyesilva]
MKKLPAVFYRTASAGEPVRDWLISEKLTDKDRRLIGRDIAKVEFGWPVGMPTCEPLGHGLFEIRTDLPNNRIARILFCISEESMVLLHGFIKKSTDGTKTPRRAIDLARERHEDMKGRNRK